MENGHLSNKKKMNNRASPTDYFVNFSGILLGLKLVLNCMLQGTFKG